jgi:hypothetical protein
MYIYGSRTNVSKYVQKGLQYKEVQEPCAPRILLVSCSKAVVAAMDSLLLDVLNNIYQALADHWFTVNVAGPPVKASVPNW